MTDKVVVGTDMINKETFEEVWKYFTTKFSGTDQDLLHGYMILKAMCAILEDAFKIDPPEVKVEGESV